MTRLSARVILALTLLGGLPAGSEAAANNAAAKTPAGPSAPQRVPGGAPMTARATQDARPTLDLLVTVRLLTDLLERRQITLDAPASRELSGLLRPLSGAVALRPAEALAVDAAVLAALAPSQAQALAQARAALEARTQAFMARARFATPDGPLNLTLIRYGLMVPGGQTTVNSLLGTTRNPYAQAGVNATVLERLLTLLRE